MTLHVYRQPGRVWTWRNRVLRNVPIQLVVAGLCLLPKTSTAAEQLSLKDILTYGLQNSPAMRANDTKAEISGNSLSNATSKLLPKLDMSVSASVGGTEPTATDVLNPNDPYSSSADLKLSQIIYDNGRAWLERDQSKINQQIALLEAKSAREKFVYDLISAYYTYSQAQLEADARDEQLKMLERQYKTISQQYRQGISAKKDFSRIHAEVQRGEISKLTALNTREQAKSKLLTMAGYTTADKPDRSDLSITAATASPDVLQDLKSRAKVDLTQTYTYQLNQLQNNSSQITVDLERRKYWPQLELSANAGYRSADFVGPGAPPPWRNDHTYWNVMLGVNYTLWDWGMTRRNIANAELTRSAQLNTRQAALNEHKREIVASEAELAQLRKSFELSLELFKLEDETFRLLDSEYRQGRVSYLELMDGMQKKIQSRISYSSSYFALKRAIMELKYFEGKLYDQVIAQ